MKFVSIEGRLQLGGRGQLQGQLLWVQSCQYLTVVRVLAVLRLRTTGGTTGLLHNYVKNAGQIFVY